MVGTTSPLSSGARAALPFSRPFHSASGHLAGAFWRLPLQFKLTVPLLASICVATAAVGIYGTNSSRASTRAAYAELASRKAALVSQQLRQSPGDTAALGRLAAQLVSSSPYVLSVAVYERDGRGLPKLVAGAAPGGLVVQDAVFGPVRLDRKASGDWLYRGPLAGPVSAEAVIEMSPELEKQIGGDLPRLLLELGLVEVAALLIGIRLWSRWVLNRRVARLTAAASAAAEGGLDVQVQETDEPHRGDELSRLGYQLSRVVRTVRRRANRQSALDALTADAARGAGIDALYDSLVRVLAEGMGAELAGVYEMFTPSRMLILRASAGPRVPRQQLPLLGPDEFHTRVLAGDSPLEGDGRVGKLLGLSRSNLKFAAIRVPGRESAYGMLLAGSAQGFSLDELQFLEAVSHTLASAVNTLHDPLTSLPNRLLFEDRLTQAVAEANRTGESVCLYYIDLDNFKEVNDSLGHHAGDQLLRHVSDRLRKVLRASDLLARLGGDEFALVQTVAAREPRQARPPDPEAVAVQTATRLLQALAAPFSVGTAQLYVSASLGVAIYPEHGADADVLSRNADRAMYEAKLEEKGAFRIFTQSMHSAAVRRLTLETGLRGALQRDELQLHYQPQVDVARPATIIGFEALLRWPGGGPGAGSPATFVPIAEQTGLIVPIGLWALRQACRQAAQWQHQGRPPVRMAVNVAAAQFARPEFVENVKQVLAETGLDPSLLELEVTEGSVMRDVEAVTLRLQQLRELGVTIAVDDFGTGYSSLAYLNRLPFDALKVDRSFVRGIRERETADEGVLVSAIVQLGRSLNKVVIAEGIETAEQLRHLQRLGCDVGQGFLFARALTPEQATRALTDANPAEGLSAL